MEDGIYLKTNEFAQYLKTTKATLRHYRDIGLLEPAHVTESGYALYGSLQVSQFMLIASLRLAGCSLSQIKDYLELANASEMRDIMIDKVSDLERKQEEIELRKQILLTSIRKADRLSQWGDFLANNDPAWRMIERDEEYFIKTPAPLRDNEETELLRIISDHGNHFAEYGKPEELQGSYGIDNSAFKQGEYGEGFALLARLPHPVKSKRLHVKPAGIYFCWLKRSNASDLHENRESNPLFEEYDKVRAFLRDQHLSPTSDVYETELSLYSGSLSETMYYEIEMQVEAESN